MVRIKFVAEKRAISPIISIILLLMMTVAVAAGAYTWFMVNQQKIQATTETQVAAMQSGMAVNLRIIELNSTRTGVIVQNMGPIALVNASASIVVNGAVVNVTTISIPAGGFGMVPIGENAVDANNRVDINLRGPDFGSAQKTFTITDNYQIEILNVTCSPCTLGSPGYCTVTIDAITYCSNNTGSCTYASQTNLTKLNANNTNNCI
jgi:flagellin-like protein